jgi:2,3-dihydroxyphenylpropionate 1,2-dioxygenase
MTDEERLAMNAAGREAAKKLINPTWDDKFLRRIVDAPESFAEFTDADIEQAGVGGNEVRTWIAAVAAGNTAMERLAYEPVEEWITGMGVVASVNAA